MFTPVASEYMNADGLEFEYPAQVITTQIGVLDPVVTLELASCKPNGLVDAQLEIVPAPGGVPDWGNPLGTAVVPEPLIPAMAGCVPGTFGDVVFTFPGLNLGAGTRYALVLKAINGTGDIAWRRSSTPTDPSNPYPGGNLWTNGQFGETEYTALDLQFCVCGEDNAALDVPVRPHAPGGVTLSLAGPNPFFGSTAFAYSLHVGGRVSLKVFDITGALVRTLVDRDQAAGLHRLDWNGLNREGREVAPGVYFVRLLTEEGAAAARAIRIR